MAAALGIGAKFLLDQTGQLAELRQNHVHQKESINWARRAFHMDSQSLLLDALDHSKEEIRSHYETYVGRIDTPLLVLALIWPFALNTIQFSDPFVPETEVDCPECIEAKYTWLVGLWVALMGTILILPFWGILMLIRCKLKLDSWLEYSLAGLNRERRHIILQAREGREEAVSRGLSERQEELDTQQMVAQLVDVVLGYQEYLARIWTAECGWLVHAATMLLWMSAVAALLLTSLSMVVFLSDKGGVHAESSPYFGVLITSGCVLPAVYVLQQRLCNTVRPPEGDPDEMFEAAFPLTSPRAQKAPRSQRCASPRASRVRSFSGQSTEESRPHFPPRTRFQIFRRLSSLACSRRQSQLVSQLECGSSSPLLSGNTNE